MNIPTTIGVPAHEHCATLTTIRLQRSLLVWRGRFLNIQVLLLVPFFEVPDIYQAHQPNLLLPLQMRVRHF